MLAPGISSAELAWNYGEGKQADHVNFLQWLADDGSRRYVKILFNTANAPVAWYGVVNGLGTKHGGVRVNALADGFFEQGRQVLTCAGLEKIFDDTLVNYAAFYDYRSSGIFYTDRGLTFNDQRPDGTPGLNMKTVHGNPVFSGLVRDDDEPWTLDKCLRYLTTYHRPRDKNGTFMPVGLAGTHLLKSTVDRPVIPTHGRSLRELLNQLLPHQRFLTWGLTVDETNNAIYVQIVSLTGDNIVLPSGDFILANERRWIFDTDTAHADVATVLSHAEGVDVIRMQGNRATSTFTLSKQEGTLDKGWTADQQTQYNAGASTTAAYAAAGSNRVRKQKLNAIARGRDSLQAVYQRLQLVDNWDGYTKHSAGGTGGGSEYFDPLLTGSFKFNPRELHFEKTLPLRDNYEYGTSLLSGQPIPAVKTGEGPFNFLPPLVVIEIPASGSDAAVDTATKKYIQLEKIGLAAVTEQVPDDPNRRWSASVHIPDQDASIVLKVSGGPGQHVLAGADFSKLPEDPIDKDKWDWRKVYATVCVKLDKYCEGLWPPQASLPDDVDYIRELVLQAPDTFRLDWLVADTIVSVGPDGQLTRAAARWINDDREKLTDRARIAFEWYGRERRAITVNSARINGNIRLGDFVSQLGVGVSREVNTVITEVRIDCPLGKNEPRVTYTTDYVRTLDLYLSPSLGSGASHRGALNVFNRKARPDFKHDVR